MECRRLSIIIGAGGSEVLLIIELQLLEILNKKVDGDGTSKITVGQDAPKNPKKGDLWIDTKDSEELKSK